MPSPLSGFGPLTGPGSTRRLGTEAGALRREARKVRRAGGDDRRLLEASGLSGMRDGSISSADSNIEEDAFERRAAAGLGAARQGVLREMAGQGGGLSGDSDTNEFGGKYVKQGGSGPGGTGSAAVPPPKTSGGQGAIPAMLRRPSAEESASDDRRYNARQGVLRDVMAKASESGKTRRQVLEDENLKRAAEGKPPLSFEADDFVSESERQKAPALEADRTRRRGIREGMIDMELTGRDVADEAAAAQRRATANAPAPRVPGPTSRASGAAMRGPKPAAPRPEPEGLRGSLRQDAEYVGSAVADVARGTGSQLGATIATGARRAGAVVGAGAGALRNAAEVAALQASDNLKTTGRRVGRVTPGATGRYLRSLR